MIRGELNQGGINRKDFLHLLKENAANVTSLSNTPIFQLSKWSDYGYGFGNQENQSYFFKVSILDFPSYTNERLMTLSTFNRSEVHTQTCNQFRYADKVNILQKRKLHFQSWSSSNYLQREFKGKCASKLNGIENSIGNDPLLGIPNCWLFHQKLTFNFFRISQSALKKRSDCDSGWKLTSRRRFQI